MAPAPGSASVRVSRSSGVKIIFPNLRAIAGDVKALTALHRNSELRQRLMGLESSRKLEVENRLTQDLDEFVTLIKGLLPEETFMEVASVLELAAERQNLPWLNRGFKELAQQCVQ